ncbi:thiamine phosphate synthase, partial [Staphylococcus aureus]
LPCVAIGGIEVGDVAPLRRAGAAGVAVVSAVSGAEDPASATRALREAWA